MRTSSTRSGRIGTVSSVASESMDVIVSWEVLEHITSPNDAFKEMARILKKGGFAFHEYNPFFSVEQCAVSLRSFPLSLFSLPAQGFRIDRAILSANPAGATLRFRTVIFRHKRSCACPKFRPGMKIDTRLNILERQEVRGTASASDIEWLRQCSPGFERRIR